MIIRCLLLLVIASVELHGQAAILPAREQLDAITRRGRMLAAYDRVAWHGSDAIMELQPVHDRVQYYIARREMDGWVLVMGKLNTTSDTFAVAYEARTKDSGRGFTTRSLQPVRPDTGYFAGAARALTSALEAFTMPARPYNMAVLPVEDGDGWWVYLFPAPTSLGVWPHGGDWRYRISRDGRKVLETRQLHRSILEFSRPAPASPSDTLVSGMHTAIVDDIVEDTDVYLVLTRRPVVREVVVSKSFVFSIDTSGVITCAVRHDSEKDPR